jgi:hypothetical protein
MEIPLEFREKEKPETSVWSTLTKDALITAIVEVIKIEPLTAKDTATYRFKFDFGEGKRGTIEINVSDFMRSYKKFEELLFSHFDITLPSKLKAKPAEFETNEWTKFVQLCGKMCTSVPPSESTTWAECDRFLEKVSGFQILEEQKKQEWAMPSSQFALLKDNKDGITYYLLKSSDATELISQKNLNLLITREQLGDVMKKRGIKRDIDGLKRVAKKRITAWWITEESLIEHGLGEEESKIQVLGGTAYDYL